MAAIEDSLKAYRDMKNSLNTAEEKGVIKGIEIGRAEGRAEGIMLTAKNLKSMGLSIADIIKATGLSENDIMKLQANHRDRFTSVHRPERVNQCTCPL